MAKQDPTRKARNEAILKSRKLPDKKLYVTKNFDDTYGVISRYTPDAVAVYKNGSEISL